MALFQPQPINKPSATKTMIRAALDNENICALCRNLNVQELQVAIRILLLPLQSSAEQGCSYCSVLFQALILSGYSTSSWTINSRATAWINRPGDSLKLRVRVVPDERADDFEIYNPEEQAEWQMFGTRTRVPEHSASEESLARIREWLAICDTQHGACKPEPEYILPRRLLAFEELGANVTLVETGIDCHAAPYACLSHCWGTSQPLTTTMTTLAKRKKGIKWDELPQTFQDAISICIKLSIKYLWIDSLSIIQDDEEDWLRESARMASTYSNAFLTISASAAVDDSQGCFRYSVPCDHHIRVTHASKPTISVRVRKQITHFDQVNFDQTSTSSEHHPWFLMRRAWAFQERLLSPRVLHFGPQELVWECRETTLCQCSNAALTQATSPKVQWHKAVLQAQTSDTLFAVWRKVVMEYSGRALTFEKDRLPAIAGAAQQLQSKKSDLCPAGTYLAGTWSEDLFKELIWHRRSATLTGLIATRRPKQYRAPSWSWAAVEGPIAFFADTMTDRITQEVHVVKCVCESLTKNVYGPFDRGLLRLETLASVLDLRYSSVPEDREGLPPDDEHVYGYTLVRRCGERRLWLIADYSLLQDIGDHGQHTDLRLGEVVVARLGTAIVSDNETRAFALVLRQTRGDGESGGTEYERIGITYQDYDPSKREHGDWFFGLETVALNIV